MTGRRGLAVWVATCGGVGFFPIWPGTVGAAVGLFAVIVLRHFPVDAPWSGALLASAAAAIFAIGVWAAGRAEISFGRSDPSPVVIDEVVGQIVTFLARPHASWRLLLLGFALFRMFDVVKPFPAGRAEHLPGGWGIMTDDVVAGLYSLAGLLVAGLLLK